LPESPLFGVEQVEKITALPTREKYGVVAFRHYPRPPQLVRPGPTELGNHPRQGLFTKEGAEIFRGEWAAVRVERIEKK
jgi:hypothetical protein